MFMSRDRTYKEHLCQLIVTNEAAIKLPLSVERNDNQVKL